MIQVYETASADETRALAESFGRAALPGQLFCLDGDLGCGKTVFAQGFARGLGIEEPVASPTFTIISEHEGGRLPFYHFDVYRIEEPEEMDEIGYEDYFYGEGVTLVEWATLIEELIPKNAVHITIEKDPRKGFDYRKISLRKEDQVC